MICGGLGTAFAIILTLFVILSPTATADVADGLSPSNPFDIHGLSYRDNSTWVLGIVDGSNCTAYERTVWYLNTFAPVQVTFIVDGQNIYSSPVDGYAPVYYTFTPGPHLVQFLIDGNLEFSSNVRVINTDVERDVIDRQDDSYMTVRMTEGQFESKLTEAGLKAILVFVLPLPLIALVIQKRLDSRSKRVV
jgi:hypothetical protein